MTPHALNLALNTPLENLLPLPGAVGMLVTLREDLAHLGPAQLQTLLVCMDDGISEAVAAELSASGGLIARADRRDVDWWLAASDDWQAMLFDLPFKVSWRDLLNLLALVKMGEVIVATCDVPPIAFSFSVVALLLEAKESWLLAQTLPEPEPLERIINEAWCTGLRPDAVAQANVGVFSIEAAITASKQEAGRKAANVRHQHNRDVKQAGLELYFNGQFRTDDEAFHVIGDQLHRAPGTVKNWVLAAKKARCA